MRRSGRSGTESGACFRTLKHVQLDHSADIRQLSEPASAVATSGPSPSRRVREGIEHRDWLSALRRYLVFIAVASLVWEFFHLPLYTIWETGSTSDLIFAAAHCTGGDVLIALSSLTLALFLAGEQGWPGRGYSKVAALTIVFGLSYTIFSEWLNIEIRESWAYRDLMPVIPVIDAGLSPVMQWIVIPLAGFRWARRRTAQATSTEGK